MGFKWNEQEEHARLRQGLEQLQVQQWMLQREHQKLKDPYGPKRDSSGCCAVLFAFLVLIALLLVLGLLNIQPGDLGGRSATPTPAASVTHTP